jgi:hypothetical protein
LEAINVTSIASWSIYEMAAVSRTARKCRRVIVIASAGKKPNATIPAMDQTAFWLQVINLVVLIATLIVLCIYARDTNHIKHASLAQAEAAKQQSEGIPCVLVIELPPDLSGRIRSYSLKNVGNGVALNIRASLPSWEKDEPVQALSPGESARTELQPEDLVFKSPFTCTFESLSGIVYQSESSYNKVGEEIVTDMRHRVRKVSDGVRVREKSNARITDERAPELHCSLLRRPVVVLETGSGA